MIEVRTLVGDAFERRKMELEQRDGTQIAPELIELAKRTQRMLKMKARTKNKLAELNFRRRKA